jgi:hypothetical protein
MIVSVHLKHNIFSYDELLSIHFTFNIKRIYTKLKKRIIGCDGQSYLSHYPGEKEGKSNAKIKILALERYFQFKKWYGHTGHRNLGKKFSESFDNFILEFHD